MKTKMKVKLKNNWKTKNTTKKLIKTKITLHSIHSYRKPSNILHVCVIVLSGFPVHKSGLGTN